MWKIGGSLCGKPFKAFSSATCTIYGGSELFKSSAVKISCSKRTVRAFSGCASGKIKLREEENPRERYICVAIKMLAHFMPNLVISFSARLKPHHYVLNQESATLYRPSNYNLTHPRARMSTAWHNSHLYVFHVKCTCGFLELTFYFEKSRRRKIEKRFLKKISYP